ncbi:MAG: UDP-N-acetyl glucosamine 2-epimerase [Lysobacteraceae bacterium]|nr:MAG: UDP-N-acetyl glucosamine 2-epimerase [Xanthomonadaceae bacterium]
MSERRRIAVVSTSRADYGHLLPVLEALAACPEVELLAVAAAAHASPRFGETWRHFGQDGIPLSAKLECLLDSDTDTGMAKTIGLATLSLADWMDRERPHLLLLIADRYEMLAPASVALALRIPIAHIEGGEVSEGAIDDAVRNALTKLAHLHFVPTEQARRRVLAMGEEAWRVHRVGAPSLDHLRKGTVADPQALLPALGLEDPRPPVVVAWHPVTLQRDPAAEAACLFDALRDCAHPLAFCFPNADAGRERIIRMAEAFCASHPKARVFVHLEHRAYWGLLRGAAALVGNSSSGIMESPALALPCVNIGDRQAGRERAANILDAPADAAAIREALARALDPAFRASLQGMVHPYGDGRASERIAEVLRSVPLDERLLRKRALPLRDDLPAFVHAP